MVGFHVRADNVVGDTVHSVTGLADPRGEYTDTVAKPGHNERFVECYP